MSIDRRITFAISIFSFLIAAGFAALLIFLQFYNSQNELQENNLNTTQSLTTIYTADRFKKSKLNMTGTDFLEIFIGGKVVSAHFSSYAVHYNESVAFCNTVNGTLPKTKFKVTEPGRKHKGIFWIAANEDTRREAEEDNRKELNVAYAHSPNSENNLCAMVVTELFNPQNPLLFICENQVFDELKRVVWVNNITVGCNIFKPNLTVMTQHEIVILDLTGSRSISLLKLSGYKKDDYFENKTGIPWCPGHPFKLSPAKRLKESDSSIVVAFIYSVASTVCVPSYFDEITLF